MAVWHCTATRENKSDHIDAAFIDRVHREERGFYKIGYHVVFLRNGSVQFGRGINQMGAHARGYNQFSIGLVYVGGLDMDGNPKDTRTAAQKRRMREWKHSLDYMFPGIEHVGHRDLSVDLNGDGEITPGEWMKMCPCFDVRTEL